MERFGKLKPISRHAGTELVDRARPCRDGALTQGRLSTHGSCMCPRPGSNWPTQPPTPRTNNRRRPTESARFVAHPAPSIVIPRATTIGQTVACGISTLDGTSRYQASPRDDRWDRSCLVILRGVAEPSIAQ